MKVCFKCGIEKELDEFYVHQQMGDGHLNKCKECNKRDVSENYRKRIAHYTEYERKRTQNKQRKQRALDYQRRRRIEHRDIERAYRIVQYHLRTGKIKREPCELCQNPSTDAHHTDYSRPLFIWWLCHSCHEMVHGKEARIGVSE